MKFSLKCLLVPAALTILSSGGLLAQNPFQGDDRRDFERLFRTNLPADQLVETPASVLARMANLTKTNNAANILGGNLSANVGLTASPATQLEFWHTLALNVTSLDHAPGAIPGPNTAQEQPGPPRTSRALAMIHLAMYEAANSLALPGEKTFQPYKFQLDPNIKQVLKVPANPTPTMQSAAIAESAFELLLWLYPGLVSGLPAEAAGEDPCSFSNKHFAIYGSYHCAIELLKAAGTEEDIRKGVAFGHEVAERVIFTRLKDNASELEPTVGVDLKLKNHAPGNEFQLPDESVYHQWRIDPVSGLKSALGGHWQDVTPFSLGSAAELRLPEPETAIALFKLRDKEPKSWPSYQALLDYSGEERLNTAGAGPVSPEQDLYYVAKFWAYDGTAGLCAPVRLYNQVADAVLATLKLSGTPELARFHAMVNIAMADAAIAAWDSKYSFQLARPVTAIRWQLNKDSVVDTSQHAIARKALARGTSKSIAALSDGDKGPEVDLEASHREKWFPLGAQMTNGTTIYNITPNFPSYPSGHAVFGGALFGILRQFVPSPQSYNFSFRSDEFNGLNRDAYNFIRCKDGDKDPRFCENSPIPMGREREFTFDCAERENADSRVWMGVHWMFDADDGILMGNRVAHQVFNKLFLADGQAARPLAAFEETKSGRGQPKTDVPRLVFNTEQRQLLSCPDLGYHTQVLDSITQSYGVFASPANAKRK